MTDKVLKGSSSVLACEMRKLINNPLMSDITFHVGAEKKVFHGHRCILSARCELFKSMLVEHANKNETIPPVILAEMRPHTFKQMLDFLYTNQIKLDKKNTEEAIELLAVAMEFGLDDLRKVIQTFLIHMLQKENVCKIYQNAHNLGLIQLKESCLKFIQMNIQFIDSFGELCPDVMEEIVGSDDLDIDELKLLIIVRLWVKSYSERSENLSCICTKQVARHLRLGLLKPDEIAKLEEENLKDNIIPPESFALAWKTHALGPSGAGANIAPKERNNPKRPQPTVSRASSQSLFE